MPILYHPRHGEILMCDFGAGGFCEPEMVKKRPVIVLSPKRYNATTCIVLPLSTKPPRVVLPCHHQMNPLSLPRALRAVQSWAKGNMIAHVALSRLDRVMYRRGSDGKRMYESTIVCLDDWAAVQQCVAHSLAMRDPPPEQAQG